MEACGSAHYWGRQFRQLGYKVKLIPPHIVARYRNGNKSDKNDAIAIYEAAKNPNIYFVTIRTLEQQDLATQHKLRAGYIKQRKQLGNRIRGFAMEYGVKFPKGIQHLRKQVPTALEDAENESFKDTLERADAYLYESKKNGRNRITIKRFFLHFSAISGRST